MSIRVNLPDGSVANFPQGMNPQQIQAEIEQYMAQSAPQRRVLTPSQDIARDVNRLRDTIGRGDGEFQENFDWQGEPTQPQPRQIPMNAMEQSAQAEAQRRGPQRRNAEISIREAIAQEQQGYQQPTMGATELNQPAMRDAVQGREAPTSEANTDRGPQRRRSDVSIREALPPPNTAEDEFQENYDWQGDPASRPAEQPPAKDPATMTDAELRAAEIAARNPIGNAGRAIADTFRGATRAAASATQNALGGTAAALGMPGLGGSLMQGADNIDASLAERRRLEAEERAASDARAQQLTDEQAQRQPTQPQAPAAQGQPTAAPATAPAPGQPASELPSIQNPNAGQRTNVSMPQGLSIQGAREQGRGEQSMSFNMGDGQTVQVRAAPPAAIKNGVKSGMDFLMERADQITLKMLQNGDITGATAFRDFVRGEQAQKGMTYMNRAVVASSYGDNAAFTSSIDKMVRAFDPDGEWQVDTKGTRLIQTDNGQAVGAMLSLRNKETGEVMEQEYMGMQNVMAAISDWGSPTAAYERQQERVAGAVGQQIANAKSYQEAFDNAMEGMFDKSSFVDLQGKAIDDAEMQRRVEMVKQRVQQVRPDLVPAGQRQQGSASGVGAGSFMGGSNGQPVPTFGG
jgi:hypothetical protein